MFIEKSPSRSVPLRFATVSMATLAILAGCVSEEESAPPILAALEAPEAPEAAPAAPECAVPFSSKIEALKIDGGHHLYFDPAQVSLFSDPALRIESVVLNSSIRGKLKGDAFEVPLALNGLQTAGPDGSSIYTLFKYSSTEDISNVRHQLHKMVVNGADPIQRFMLKILKNKGTIKVSLQGKNLHVLSAEIDVRGYSFSECGSSPDPEPSQSPTPGLPAVAPKTSIDSVNPEALETSLQIISISFSSDQLGSSFQCSLDGAPFELCSSPQAYSGLADGVHVFKVFATNAAGVSDPLGASRSWTVNSQLPGATLENLASMPAISSSSSIDFSFSQPGASGYLCSIDGGEFVPCSSPATYSGLSDGLHQFAVTSIDSYGNVAGNPAQFQWVVDTAAPVATIISANPASAFNNSSSMEIGFMANEAAEFECAVDAAEFSACTSPFRASTLDEGEHLFQVRARDVAGNLGNATSYSWTTDLSAPVISLANASPAPGLTSSRQISVEFSASELASFECSFDGAEFEACSSPFAAPVFNDGNHGLSVVAIDAAGNRSAPLNIEWLMDFLSPEISFLEITPSAASHINSNWLNATISSSEAVVLISRLNDVELAQNSSPISLSGLSEGAYSLLVSAMDAVGNASGSILHSFNVDLTAPSVSLSAEFSGVTNSTSNSIVINSSEAGSLECQLNGAGFASCASPVAISGLAEGSHSFEVRAIDLAGNVGASASMQWGVDLTAPVVALTVNRTVNSSIQFSFSANEGGSAFLCSMDNGAFAPCLSPISYNGLSAGAHSFAVKARDMAGNVGAPASHAWSVDPAVNTYITSASPGSSPTTQNSASFAFGSNVGVSFRCSLDGGAASACGSPSSYYGLSDGTHTFRVYAVDRWGTQDANGASYSWNVDTTPPVVGTITTSTTRSSITITWTTNEGANGRVNWGVGYDTSRVNTVNTGYVTTQSITLTGLMPNTLYSFIVSGSDAAGNAYSSTRRSVRTNY